MNVADLVADLERRGARLRLVGGRLDIESDVELPTELLDMMAREKPEVIAYLAERSASAPVKVSDKRVSADAAPRPEITRTLGAYEEKDEPSWPPCQHLDHEAAHCPRPLPVNVAIKRTPVPPEEIARASGAWSSPRAFQEHYGAMVAQLLRVSVRLP